MNKTTSKKLSAHDNQLLARIENGFERAQNLLGNEPLIYHEFGIIPDTEDVTQITVIQHRHQLFDKIAKANSKKV
ncbi:MAG: hypothetical protein M3Q95_10050 [Bacteroidota bacterium]|nr:hypothetical protein [Bacteroidota bacterium]